MKCPFCGSVSNRKDICNHCGKVLNEHHINGQPRMQTMVNSNMSNEKTYEINDNELLNVYIGNNVESLRDNSFSWCTFFFGTMYLFYRKMWVMGILYSIARNIPILNIIVTIYFSSIFKKEYVKNALSKIEAIKFENARATNEELIKICKKKGGTTISPIVVIGLLYATVAILIMIIMLPEMSSAKKEVMVTEARTYVKAAETYYTEKQAIEDNFELRCVRFSTLRYDYISSSSVYDGYIEFDDNMNPELHKIYMTNGEKGINGTTVGELNHDSISDISYIEIPSNCR